MSPFSLPVMQLGFPRYLELLLEDWSPRFAGYHIYYPSRHQNLPAFKVVVNALRQ